MNHKYQIIKAGRVISSIRADKVDATLVVNLYFKGYVLKGTYTGQ